MTTQPEFFNDPGDGPASKFPQGFRYRPEMSGAHEEATLIARLSELLFREFEFHGLVGKRRTVSFGWRYDFSGRGLRKADDIPDFLLPLRQAAAAFAGMGPERLQHVLVIEYGPGAGIGWRRDKAVFGEVVGVTLLSECLFRMRRKIGERRRERVNLTVEPRSAYHLSGDSRTRLPPTLPLGGSAGARPRLPQGDRSVRDNEEVGRH